MKKHSDGHQAEKIPHNVDSIIKRKASFLTDAQIASELAKMGHPNINRYNVGYRRRKLGKRKYERGEIKKHKAWVRAQAIKRYGSSCELCTYNQAVDTHHVLAKRDGGPHEINNLMVICPNCHALITRGKIVIPTRSDIPKARNQILQIVKSFYSIF